MEGKDIIINPEDQWMLYFIKHVWNYLFVHTLFCVPYRRLLVADLSEEKLHKVYITWYLGINTLFSTFYTSEGQTHYNPIDMAEK